MTGGNKVLSQADIDALLGGASASEDPPPPAQPDRSESQAGEIQVLQERVARLEAAVESTAANVSQIDVLVTRLERVEQAVISMQQARNADMKKLQMQLSTHLNAIMERVRANRPAAAAGGGARPAASPAPQRAPAPGAARQRPPAPGAAPQRAPAARGAPARR
ncbi:MAG: hypothetical protein V3S18_04880 [Dehalococcoidia bacterium]